MAKAREGDSKKILYTMRARMLSLVQMKLEKVNGLDPLQ
jgi:hypothetical protein